MLRKNFLETSGVIVDVCSAHGVWFDRGELTKIFAFAATGELARAEQDLVKRIDSRKRIDAFERDMSTVFFWSMRI
jgi:Zn-finger nucleic acid-binding protein